ncbi:MAG: hypothetical protein DRH90_05145 [Deltaproteobacteria bacterium]|nr:MAG: hypothetical protein DRH90_05145 [Deltaproteobacteria bacterium]RLC14493.1 MAG: hypothetical protein DRI24_13370 [Deltaproteobacteria bacterium]
MQKQKLIATARCHPLGKADNRGVAEGEDGYFNGTTGLPVGFHSVIKPGSFRSEIFGYADGGSYLNPKHEIRNPKRFDRLTALSNVEGQYRMIKTRPWRYKFKHYV